MRYNDRIRNGLLNVASCRQAFIQTKSEMNQYLIWLCKLLIYFVLVNSTLLQPFSKFEITFY